MQKLMEDYRTVLEKRPFILIANEMMNLASPYYHSTSDGDKNYLH